LLFPIDCISHDTVATLKRLCRQLEKPYLPLRAASLATLASSLAGINRGPWITTKRPSRKSDDHAWVYVKA
jgi:hypothetical protein